MSMSIETTDVLAAGFLGRDPATVTPGLAAHDPRFLRITDLVDARRFEEAAEEAGLLLQEGFWDVRLLGYQLFQTFHDGGVAALPGICGAFLRVNGDLADRFGPVEKRSLHLGRALSWLLRTILDQTAYHQQKGDEVWRRWSASAGEGRAEAALEAVERLSAALSDPTFQAPGELLGRLARWLRELREVQHTADIAPPETEVAVVSAQARLGEPAGPGRGGATAMETPSGFLVLGQSVQLRASAEFVELANRLRAFELLVDRGQFDKAALVSHDVLAALEAFDPRKYFPDLFGRFSELLATNAARMVPHWDRKGTMEWQLEEQFYRLDLERFVNGGGSK
jgi:hypothetical protein